MRMLSRLSKNTWTDIGNGTRLYVLDTAQFDDGDFPKAYEMMSESRKLNCDKLKRKQDKKCCVFADFSARSVLSEIVALPPEKLVFDKDGFGKPYLVNGKCFFNYSHSDTRIALAVNPERECGADIEKIRPVDLNVILRVCSSLEREYVFSNESVTDCVIRNEEILKRFFAVWTYKEAFLKCRGTGIIDDLQKVCFDPSDCFLTEIDGFSLCCATK